MANPNSNVSPGGRGGGGGFTLGPAQNTFGSATTVTTAPGYAADQAAAETLRDAYATANAAWLALYTGDRSSYIRLIWTGNATAFQRRNAAGTGWEDVSRIVPGTTGGVGPPGPTRTATQIAALLDAFIGNALWRSRLSGSDLLDAADLAVGSTVWRTAHTALRTATQIVALLDAHLLGTTWRTPGAGGTGLDAAAVTAAIAAAGHDTPAARDSAIAAAIAAAAIAGAGAIPVTLLSSGSVADPGASVVATELTLTADIIRGYLLEFVEAGTPAAVGYITSDLILDQTQTYNSTPGPNVAGRLAIKIQESSDKAFAHDTIHLWRSDEANKLWFAAGRTGMQTLTIRAYPLSAAVEDWAKTGNTDQIPADRLGNAPAGTGGGITTAQATDAAGALLATVSFFTYDSSTDVLTLAIPDGYILPAMLVNGTDVQKTAFRTKIGAEQSGAVRPDGSVAFTATIVGITPTAIGHLTRKDYVDGLVGARAALSGATFTGIVSGIAPTAAAHFAIKTYVDSADGLKAALAGALFTGSAGGIAPVGDADFVTKEYADANYSGSTPVQTHDLWVGWSTDNTVTETEVLAGVSSDSATATLPTGTGNQFLWVWRSNLDGGDPSEVYIAGGLNVRNTLGAAGALTVSGVAGQIIVSVTSQNVGLLGGENVRVA